MTTDHLSEAQTPTIDDEIVVLRKEIRQRKAELEDVKLELNERKVALSQLRAELEKLLDRLEHPEEWLPMQGFAALNGKAQVETDPQTTERPKRKRSSWPS